MGKLIIENRTELPIKEILPYAVIVVEQGKISETAKGEQYSFATLWENGIMVVATKNKKSDRLIVIRENNSNGEMGKSTTAC